MPKRPLCPSSHSSESSSSSSSSSSWSSSLLRRRRSRLQLLHGLPDSLLAAVCSFLSVYQVVCKVRRTCHALHSRVSADSLQQSHLYLSPSALPSLVTATSGTRLLVSRIASLHLVFQDEAAGSHGLEAAMLFVQQLRSPLDGSRFLFSSLTSLKVTFDPDDGQGCPLPLQQGCLLSVLLLLAANPASCTSLRRLHLRDKCGERPGAQQLDVPFSPLARLTRLTYCSVGLESASAFTCTSLLSALTSMQTLTYLDLEHCGIGALSNLLLLLWGDATVVPLLLRLRSLLLPRCHHDDPDVHRLHNRFLCRLSSLPAPPALERFSGLPVSHRDASLLSVFSLPHLTALSLEGSLRRTELSDFTSSFTSAPAPLVSLVLPTLQIEPNDGERDVAAVVRDAVIVSSGMLQLLSRFRTLRRLGCDAAMASGAVGTPDDPVEAATGLSGSLYCLMLQRAVGPRLPFTAPLSFPLLTELGIEQPMTDEELELLLSACPQLLRLQCVVERSWNTVLIAARCCPSLLHLSVFMGRDQPERVSGPASAWSQPGAGAFSSFLPQLIHLSLTDIQRSTLASRACDFSVLRQLTAVADSELRHVQLEGPGLTAHDVLSLQRLPRLAFLSACKHSFRSDAQRRVELAEVERASQRTRQSLLQLLNDSGASAHWHYRSSRESREDVEDREQLPPLGPHQQLEMRQRVLDEGERAAHWNLLRSSRAVDAATSRAVFFDELRFVLTAQIETEATLLSMRDDA